MPHAGCCRGRRGDGFETSLESNSTSDGDFFIGDAPFNYSPHQHLEIVHTDINVDLKDMNKKCARFAVKHTVSCNHANHKSLTLNGIGFLDVVVADPSGAAVDYRYDGKSITIVWDSPFSKVGETRQIDIKYTVQDPVSGMHFSVPDERFPQKTLHVITDNETERARYWLATVDAPICRPTIRWTVTAPDAVMTILANGKQTSETVESGRKTVVHELDYGCPSYLLSLAVGDFIRVDDGEVSGCSFAYFAPRGVATEEQLKLSFAKVTPDTMIWMQKRLGVAFPFLKYRYFQVVAPEYPSAMENITQTTWNTMYLLDETWALEYKHWVDLINCHEMAHSYFGDAVTIRHFDHAWLKESWADYMESCWLEHFRGKEEFEYNLHLCSELYFGECGSYTRPIATKRYNSSWQMYDNHLYPGGARRIHMLRRLLGDETFWAAVRDYIETYNWENAKKNKSMGVASATVETDLFRMILEKHSGFNLTPFFDQWIYGRGYPKLQGTMTHDAEKGSVSITLTQTQEVNKANQMLIFEMDFPIVLKDSKGKEHKSSISFKGENKSATVSFQNLQGAPVHILIDPDYTFLFSLSFNPGEDILINVLNDSKAPIPHRIWAVKELIKSGTRTGYLSIKKALINKDGIHYGLQVEAARAAKSSKSFLYVNILCDLLDGATHPMALAGITSQCIGVRDGRMRAALLRFLNRPSPLPYRSHARALEALGGQVNREDFTLLKDHAEKAEGGWRGLVRSGAIRGMSQLCSADAYNWILARIEHGNESPYTLPECVRCLGTAAYWLEAASKSYAQSKCVELLRDPEYSVRMAAVESLVTLKAGSVVVAEVEAIEPTLSNQDAPWLHSKISALKVSSTSSTGDASQMISSLKEEIKQLQERISKLESAATSKDE